MKKRMLILCLMLLSFQFVRAQFSLGIESGLNLSNVKEDPQGTDTELNTNYFIGLAPRYAISEKLTLIADLNYSTKGYQIAVDGALDGLENRFTYLMLSPQVEYRPHQIIGIGAGFYTGLRLDEEQKIPGAEWSSTKNLETISAVDYGIILSLRSYYKGFYLKFSYDHGLQDIANFRFINPDVPAIENSKRYNRNVQIGLGYLIKFKKN